MKDLVVSIYRQTGREREGPELGGILHSVQDDAILPGTPASAGAGLERLSAVLERLSVHAPATLGIGTDSLPISANRSLVISSDGA